MKRQHHDMHNGLPDWAIKGTHVKHNVKNPERFVEKIIGHKHTNKYVAHAGQKRHEGEMCDVYVYYYDNLFYGRFLAKTEKVN